jgi:dTDP-4-dehydrorhamnose 3,5-epimerase-like enzyme
MNQSSLIEGKVHSDNRGSLISYNDFNLSQVKRMYIIENLNTDIIRAWQAHKKEHKWFFVCKGSFLFITVQVDDFSSPSEILNNKEWIISAEENKVLHVPGGFANGFRSLTEGSRLLVFSNSTLEESKTDDYRFEPNYWYDWSKTSN